MFFIDVAKVNSGISKYFGIILFPHIFSNFLQILVFPFSCHKDIWMNIQVFWEFKFPFNFFQFLGSFHLCFLFHAAKIMGGKSKYFGTIIFESI